MWGFGKMVARPQQPYQPVLARGRRVPVVGQRLQGALVSRLHQLDHEGGGRAGVLVPAG